MKACYSSMKIYHHLHGALFQNNNINSVLFPVPDQSFYGHPEKFPTLQTTACQLECMSKIEFSRTMERAANRKGHDHPSTEIESP
jgi:hypothetical protein